MTLCRLMQRPVLHFLLIVATLASAGANEPAGQRSASAPIRAEFKSGLLTLESRAAPLRVVLDRIGELAGFETVVVGEFAEEPRVTITLARVPLRAAIALVLGETSSIIVDGPAVAGSGRRAIAQLWLLGSAGAGRDGTNGAATASSRERETARDAKARSESVLRLARRSGSGASSGPPDAQALAELIRTLQSDPASIVRVRAAMALGALRDERSLAALEAAVSDQHYSVRAQAVSALGQIDSERATAILGRVLADTSVGRSERVIAAQALWRRGSESARAYLSAGAADPDEKIRSASSRAPASPRASMPSGPAVSR